MDRRIQAQLWSEAFAEIAGVAGFVVDGRGILRFVMGGLAPEPAALEGHPVAELFPDEPEVLQALDAVRRGEADVTSVRIHREGHELETRLRLVPDPVDGSNTVFGVCVDITDRVSAEERLAAEGRFLAAVSHELRTPLNAVLGFAELLETDRLDALTPRQSRYVANVRRAGRHMLALINDLLDLAAAQAGKLTFQVEPFRISHALEEALESTQQQLEAKGIHVTTQLQDDLLVAGDRRRTVQVLLNLLANAARFTPLGGSVRVTAEACHGFVKVAVSDTGIGIPPADVERIFDRFEQVNPLRAAERLGSGLGLALSRQVVNSMGGDLTVQSTLGQGSTFTLKLPRAAPLD